MAKIGFDARMADHPGIGRYIRELSRELVADPAGSQITFLRGTSPIYSLSEQVEMGWRSRHFDLLHVPHFNIPVMYGGKLVVTVHDLIYLRNDNYLRYAYVSWLFRVIEKKAAAVITVSEYTKKDLLDHFPSLRPDRVFVTYEAASPIFQKITDSRILDAAKERFAIKKPFVLYVGSLKAHKNIPALIRAMDFLRRGKKIEHELVLVGRSDPKNREMADLLARHSFVRYLGELSDSDLVYLYNMADLFVLPSFWEGFGLPVLEAMACGTPVAVSNRASLPEVAGDAALLVDPASVDGISDVLYNILSDNELRKDRVSKGFDQVKRFSWKNTAQQTLKVYQQVLA